MATLMPSADRSANKPVSLRAYAAATSALTPLTHALLAWRARRGKEDLTRKSERLGIASKERPEGLLAWIHAASVGETNAVLPLILKLREKRPDIAVLLTTGTVTSARLAEARMPGFVIHQYVPLDLPASVRRFLDHWSPDLVLFAESEIWPNLVGQTAERRIPLILANARMSERSFKRWKRRPAMARALFGRFDLVMAQSDAHAERFSSLGAANSITCGNLKIDAPAPHADPDELKALKKRIGKRPVFLAASTHPGEHSILMDAHRRLARSHKGLLTIICPRHPQRGGDLLAAGEASGLQMAQRSRGAMPDKGTEIYIADTIGELGLFYALAPLAFIGGSLVPHGGQNPIEAIRHGAAVITGPLTHNFASEYDALKNAKGCVEAGTAEDLAVEAGRLLGDARARQALLKKGERAVAQMSGALAKSLKALGPLLPPQKGKRRARMAK